MPVILCAYVNFVATIRWYYVSGHKTKAKQTHWSKGTVSILFPCRTLILPRPLQCPGFQSASLLLADLQWLLMVAWIKFTSQTLPTERLLGLLPSTWTQCSERERKPVWLCSSEERRPVLPWTKLTNQTGASLSKTVRQNLPVFLIPWDTRLRHPSFWPYALKALNDCSDWLLQ